MGDLRLRISQSHWLGFLALVLVSLTFYHLGVYDRLAELSSSWEREKEIELQLKFLHEENTQLKTSIADLAPAGPAIEQIARQKLQMARQGEALIKVPGKR